METLDDLLANRLPASVADSLREHVGACASCQSRLGQTPKSARAFSFLSPPEAPGELGRLGEYRIRGILGEGGMAIVFDAEDELLHRFVALKVLEPENSTDTMRQRFLREARALASIHEEHVVALHQVGEANGVAWMAMEKLRGETLEDRLKRDHSLSVAEALSLTRQAAEGLQAVHARGLVHRDIKPSNLWLETTANGRFKRVKLIDFGIARAINPDTELTQGSSIVGTPAFLSPEQAAGRPIDGRSDLYSLGCVLYRMLTGMHAFAGGGENTIAHLESRLAGDMAPLNTVAPQVPAPVAELIREMLAIDPDKRPGSAEVLIARLRRLEQQAQDGGSFAPALSSGKGRRRRPGLVGIWLGAITIVAALIIGGVTAYHKIVPPGKGSSSEQGGTAGEPLRLGILHSLTGTVSVHERPIVQATRLAIDEINAAGGILGRQIEFFAADGASEEKVFAAKAKHLIEENDVDVLFGCWTSSSRKLVAEVCGRHDRLLFYPSGCEGMEQSPSVVYLGGTPNQTIIPLAKWAYAEKRKRRFFLVGSEYVYSHAVNAILEHELKDLGATIAGTRYTLLGETDFAGIVKEIVNCKADMILCSIDGQSNVAFFQALRSAGITSEKVPTVWFAIGESELSLFSISGMKGDYSVGNYFDTISRPENQEFLKRFRDRYHDDERVNDPMETAYFGVYLWKKAVEKGGTTDTTKVREALRGLTVEAPEGPIKIDARTLHAFRTARIGQVEVVGGRGQFRIVFSSPGPLAPEPFPGWRTPAEWQQFLHGLYVEWGNQWEKHK